MVINEGRVPDLFITRVSEVVLTASHRGLNISYVLAVVMCTFIAN